LSFFRYSDPNAGLSQQEELDNYFKAEGGTALQKAYRENKLSYMFSTVVFKIILKLINMLDNRVWS
jgi:hypothetical protein